MRSCAFVLVCVCACVMFVLFMLSNAYAMCLSSCADCGRAVNPCARACTHVCVCACVVCTFVRVHVHIEKDIYLTHNAYTSRFIVF